MALALQIHNRGGRITPHATSPQSHTQHGQGSLAAGVGRGRLDHLGQGITLSRLKTINPAIHEAIMGLEIVGLVVDLHLVPPQADAVVGIRRHRSHGPPGDRTGCQLLETKIRHQLAD